MPEVELMVEPIIELMCNMDRLIETFEIAQASINVKPIKVPKLIKVPELVKVPETVQVSEPVNTPTVPSEDSGNSKKSKEPGKPIGLDAVKSVAKSVLNVGNIEKTIAFAQDSVEAYVAQSSAEAKLENSMKSRMNATQAMITSVKSLALQEQQAGGLSDEVQMAGASEASMYLNNASALETLMPAMNDLALQQTGLNTSSEDMVSIGNAVGMAMNGQTDGLTQLGIGLNDSQKAMLRNASEQEKAAMLAQAITDNVGDMNNVLLQTPEGQISQMKNGWSSIVEEVGSKLYPILMNFFSVMNENMPAVSTVMDAFGTALAFIGDIVLGIITMVSTVGRIFVENWSAIQPILFGIVAALLLYNGYLAIVAISQKIATMAQNGLNAAFLACPLVWIILIIIAVIAAIYGVIAMINHFAKTSISATGLIIGAFAAVGAGIWNIVSGAWNLILDLVSGLMNLFSGFANFFSNIFENPISSIIYAITDMADGVLGVIESIASAIDSVFGTNFANGVAGWRVSMKTTADNLVKTVAPNENYEKKFQDVDLAEKFGLNRMSYETAYNKGYEVGENIDKQLANIDKKDFKVEVPPTPQTTPIPNNTDSINNISNDTKGINNNVSAMTNDTSDSKEYLKYMRDIAERDVINKFTSANVNIKMTNNNTVNSDRDLDGICEYIRSNVEREMLIAAEGVH